MANLNAPEVTGIDNIIKVGDSLPISSFFSVFDPDGDEIVEYSVKDDDGTVESSFLTLNGSVLAAGEFHTFDAEELANVRYHAGTVVGDETLRVRASDGIFNSNTAIASVFTVRENTTRPIMETQNMFSVANEFIKVSTFYNGYDPDGYPNVRMKFKDLNAKTNSGNFRLDGIRQASNTWFYVRADQFDKLEYFSGTQRTRENLLGRVFDGEKWSRPARCNFTTSPNVNRPVVEPYYIAKGASESFPVTELFGVTDADGNSIKSIEFRDVSLQSNSGFLTVKGIVQPAGTWLTVNAEDLADTTFTTGSVNRIDSLLVKAFDGRSYSSAQKSFVAVSTRPVVEPKPPLVFDGDQTVDLVSIIDQSDDGPRNVLYRIYDDSANPFSARFILDGNFLAPKQIHVFDANTMARVQMRTGDFNTRRLDDIYVQTYNGVKWSVVRELQIATEPRMLDAMANIEDTVLNQRNSWRMWLSNSPNVPLEISYSFREIRSPGLDLFTTRFSNQERIETRNIMTRLESIYDVNFVEISDNFFDPVTGNQGGTMRIGHGILDIGVNPDDPAEVPWGGDIFLTDIHKLESLQPGSLAHSTFLRLLGNALGLRDSASTTQVFNPLLFKWPLPTSSDDQRQTVMSDNYNPDNQTLDIDGNPTGIVVPVEPSRFGIYDANALRELYGPAQNALSGDDVYGNTGDPQNINDWSAKVSNLAGDEIHDRSFQTAITGDGGGVDTIDVSNMLVSSVIDLTPGSYSSIGEITLDFVDFFPAQNNVSIGRYTIIENVIGGVSDEVIRGNFTNNLLIGNDGDDVLEGGGGSDTLVGGEGNDRYLWKLSDQNTAIRENLGGGDDVLEINSHWALDDLTEDFKFRKLNIDGNPSLEIDMTINDALSQGLITIENMGSGLSRVETMRLNYSDGSSVDIDMKSIFDAATTTARQMVLTEDFTSYGLVAELA